MISYELIRGESTMNNDRENIKAGLFVLTGVFLAIFIVFALSDIGRLFESRQNIKVYYSLSNGLHGLKVGAPITLGDQLIGQVTSIENITEETEPNRPRIIGNVVTASIPRRYQLYNNAVIELKSPLIGSGTSLNIRSVGDEQPYQNDETITGAIAGSAQVHDLMREVGIQDTQQRQIQNIITHIESLSATLREDIPLITGSAAEVIADIREATPQYKNSDSWISRNCSLNQAAKQEVARSDRHHHHHWE